MIRADKSISVNTFTLVNPHLYELIGLLNSLDLGSQETLENVGQVTHIELVMEVRCGLSELHGHFVVELKCLLDHGSNMLGNGSLELSEMLVHERRVDGVEGSSLGEVD